VNAPARRPPRLIPLAWGAVAFLALAALGNGPGISREEAGALAAAGAVPGDAGADGARPPLAPLTQLSVREPGSVAVHLRFSLLARCRLGSALAAGVLSALLSFLAGELGGAGAAALAPALLLGPPRLLLPLLAAGPRAAGTALFFSVLLLYRASFRAARRPGRGFAALGCGGLFGLALPVEPGSCLLLGVVLLHAALLQLGGPSRPGPAAVPRRAFYPRSALLAVLAMASIGPACALASWPWLWTDTLSRAGEALASVRATGALLHMGRFLPPGRPPLGFPLLVTALSLPAAVVGTFAAGVLHAGARLWGGVRSPREPRGGGSLPGPADEFLLLLGAAGPFVAAQLGLAARVPGPDPWLAAFPLLAVVGARALLACAAASWPARARLLSACLAAAVLAPAATALARSYPELGASWGELAGGTPGAASLGLPRQEGEAAASLLPEISSRARPGARVHFGSVPIAALAVYAAEGRIRQDLVAVTSPREADLAVVSVGGGPQDEDYRIRAAFQTSTPVAGAYLDEVPLAWVYARPGAWR